MKLLEGGERSVETDTTKTVPVKFPIPYSCIIELFFVRVEHVRPGTLDVMRQIKRPESGREIREESGISGGESARFRASEEK